MAVELHLPDLPEVEVTLGPARGRPPRPRLPWHLRLRETLAASLPLLLMGLLALATWWLVRHTPVAEPPREAAPARRDPDYTMSAFTLQRFDAAGQPKLRIEGREMRHFPDTDRVEIDAPAIRAVAPDGRVTLAAAQRALANGDASEVQLFGDARVETVDAAGQPVEISSEFLHFFVVTERVSSNRPVQVRHGADRFGAAGMQLDLAARRLDFQGPVRAELAARRP